jgi:hypothetical protein
MSKNYSSKMKNHFLNLMICICCLSLQNKVNAQIFFEDFEGAIFPPIDWTLIDSDGDSRDWIQSEGSGQLLSENGNYHAGSYSWQTGALTPDNWLISPQISIVDPSTVLRFRAGIAWSTGFGELLEVYISTTGTNIGDFIPIWNNRFRNADQGTWFSFTLALSAYAGQNIHIAFRHYDSSDEFWVGVDDVMVEIPAGSDLAMADYYIGEYSMIPLAQNYSPSLWGLIMNMGTVNQTNVYMEATSGAYSDVTEVLSELAVGGEEWFNVEGFTPSTLGEHTITLTAHQDQEDEDLENNSISSKITLSEYTFARDLNQTQGFLWAGSGNNYEIGNYFEIFEPNLATSISFATGSGNVGTSIRVSLYDIDGNLLSSSQPYEIQAGDESIGGVAPNMISLELDPPYSLDAGSNVIAAVTHTNSSSGQMTVASSTMLRYSSSGLIIAPNLGATDWTLISELGTNEVPIVRLNLGEPICIIDIVTTQTSANCDIFDGQIAIEAANGEVPNGYTYSWTGTSSGTSGGGQGTNFTITNITQGNYIISVENGGCSSSVSVTVGISNSVTPTISITVDPSNEICEGENATFTANITNGGDTPNYQWQVNGTNVGTNSPTFSSSSLTNGQTVTCVLTSNNPCANPSIITSNGITINSSGVTPSISIAASQTSVCSGESVTFTATSQNGGSNPIYQWQVNGTNVGTNSPNFTSSSLTNGSIVTCNLTSNNPCANPSNASSNSVSITVNGLTPTISISSNTTSICSGETVVFTANITNGGLTPTYQWQVNGTNAGINAATFNTSSLTNGQTVTCILTSSEACILSNNITSNSISITVNTAQIPTISISSDKNEICTLTSVIFTANVVGGTNPNLQWYEGNNAVGTNSNTYTTTTLSNGEFVVCRLTTNDACSGATIQKMSNYLIMSVIDKAVVSANANILTSLTSGNSYQWYDCATDQPIEGATNQVYTALQAGSYKVKVELDECSVFSPCFNVFYADLLEESLSNDIMVYPNPTSSFINIESQDIESVKLRLINGQSILNVDNINSNNYKLNLENLANGIYILEISNKNKLTTVKRVIKQ